MLQPILQLLLSILKAGNDFKIKLVKYYYITLHYQFIKIARITQIYSCD